MGEAPNPERRRKPTVRLRQAVEAALFSTARTVAARLPRGGLLVAGRLLGDLAYAVDGGHRRVALQGLRIAFPDRDGAERRRIARQSFRNLAQTVLETLAAVHDTPEAERARVEWVGWEHFEAAEREGRGVLLMTAHFGNWEAVGQAFALRDRPPLSLARPFDNPRIDRLSEEMRTRHGLLLTPKRGGARPILETLTEGGRVILLIDQRVHPNEGKAYRFFGKPAYTSPLLAQLSIRTGAPVLPVYGYPIECGRRLRVVIKPPIPPPADEDEEGAVERLTLGYLNELEETISEDPGLWVWMHRRWRKNPTRVTRKRLSKHAAGPHSDEVIG